MSLYILRDSPANFLQIFSHFDTLMPFWHLKAKTNRICLFVESFTCFCISLLAFYLRVHFIHLWYLLLTCCKPFCHLYKWSVSFFLNHHVSFIFFHSLTDVDPLSLHQKHGRVSRSPHYLQYNQKFLQSKPLVIL